jgi:beta-glucosidase
MAWYPGQQGGTAISEIITGKVSPSGKLPVSFEEKLEDNPCYVNYYENVPRMRAATINPYSRNEYREGIFVGYRGYEKNGVKPIFPFGFGLSYTTFEYSDLNIVKDGAEFVASFNVKNTGKVAGDEIVQLYLSDKYASVIPYESQLRGFERVSLKPGETRTVNFVIEPEEMEILDINYNWTVEPGEFEVRIGASSEDIRLKDTFIIK